MIYRLILPKDLPTNGRPKAVEGEYSQEQLDAYNAEGYNVYYLPNYPSIPPTGRPVDGTDIDTFNYVFADYDHKHGAYESKEAFTATAVLLSPSLVVDSGNGIHAYWQVSDLDAMSFLRLQRRLCRLLNTDEAVAKIYQLMRLPGSVNTKDPENPKMCHLIYSSEAVYTCEQLDALLPAITMQDESYCQAHYDKTYNLTKKSAVDEKMPARFGDLLKKSKEAREIWAGNVEDRSAADYRLGHLMFADGFTRDQALSVLVNSSKAMQRAPKHRVGYAENIVDKIWTFEAAPTDKKAFLALSSSVRDILSKSSGDSLKGTRFPCWPYLDATEHGFRLGQVIGLVAGSGVGKTAMALNMFEGFVKLNPDYVHFFVPLEQPAHEIADRWKTMCAGDEQMQDKVQIISNYDDNGGFRHLTFDDIRKYILAFQEHTGKKAGCVVIDHIGALKKGGSKSGESQDLIAICHLMKAFAVETNTLLIMQSQAPREKAGIGDLELSKDAAFGTVFFESYCDYLMVIFQPLKRCYSEEGCPTVTAFKFCKIRHKKQGKDKIHEDVNYKLMFDPTSEKMRTLTQAEDTSFQYFLQKATNLRKADRKVDLVPYQSVNWTQETA